MERLTDKDEYGYYAPRDVTLNCLKHRGKLVDRLAAYEDTGLEPEEVKAKLDGLDEFQKLEAEGRLVVLPCKLGEPIFRIETGYCDWRDQDRCAAYCDGLDYACPDYRADKEVVYGHFTFSDAPRFGKTVFLSREEAEEALKQEVESDA